MARKQTMPMVNLAFIAMIAIVAITSAVSFIWLTEIVHHSVRTATLARELIAIYGRLGLDRAGQRHDPTVMASLRAELAAKSDELAQRVTATSKHSTKAMICVAVSSFGTILAGVSLMVLVSRRIARPLSLMLQATDRIAGGDLGHRVDYDAGDEMGLLARSFDRMARCLQRSLGELVKQKQTLEKRIEESTADLRAMSLTDDLTSLPNLRHLHHAFAQAAERAGRGHTPLTLAVTCIDDFRTFNDRFGYDAGNLVLVAFARIVRAAAHDADTVARGSGVQFLVLMPGMSAIPHAFVRQVEASLESIQKLLRYRTGKHVGITVSLGVAQYPADGQSLDALLAAANKDLGATRVRIGAEAAADATLAQAKEPS